MRSIGILCGVGSMLLEARRHGFHLVGNIETRQQFRVAPWVWDLNFPDTPFYTKLGGRVSVKGNFVEPPDFSELSDDWYEPELALGHPPCGSYSSLGYTGVSKDKHDEQTRLERERKRNSQLGLMAEFVTMINEFHPKVFALDNLPKAMRAVPLSWWEENLPSYKLTVLEMSNFDYGNPQRRKRLWVIGTLHHKRFKFVPPRKRLKGPKTAWEAIRDLPWEPWKDIPELAHFHHPASGKPVGGLYLNDGIEERRHARTMDEAAFAFLGLPNGYLWPYITGSGRYTKKAAHTRVPISGPSRVLTGGETLRHPITGWPLTPRERARIMGWPDDFKLYPDKIPTRTDLIKMVKLTGKAVPSEFPRYLINQLIDHIGKIR